LQKKKDELERFTLFFLIGKIPKFLKILTKFIFKKLAQLVMTQTEFKLIFKTRTRKNILSTALTQNWFSVLLVQSLKWSEEKISVE
jgi:hypothetical protein